ncbi:diguanylate cyclase domain-containing protein [Marinobacter salexigens]|uniref:GGDEF domain-containing response regulator n=1 Tax=Marinobacter salexigens TaxID=1925763 RepID=UPI000C28D982|nr:diguanylate cyclase [Marinobacter salexigens]
MRPEPNKILVVDDDRISRQFITEILKSDYRIILASDADKAMERAIKHQPDLILLDIVMPRVDGFELFKTIKKHPLIMHIPIIFLTALTLESEEEAGLAMGAVDYITKPLRAPIVQARVKNHIQLINQRKQLELLAVQDPLTGIPNRRRFDVALDAEWRRCKRDQSPLSLAMIDVDNFKAYNDSYGHAAGDSALRAIAHALSSCVRRAPDICARFGGEEFALILPDTTAESLATISENCRHAVEALEIRHAGNALSDRITVSVGGATTIPSDEIGPDDLLKRSDEMLYIAKQQGRNKVSVTV